MAILAIEVEDEMAIYLGQTAARRGILLSNLIEEIIIDHLALSTECDDAIALSGLDVSDSDTPVLDAIKMLKGVLEYRIENERLLMEDSLSLFTLRKIDARLPEGHTRDGFLCDLMDHMEEAAGQ